MNFWLTNLSLGKKQLNSVGKKMSFIYLNTMSSLHAFFFFWFLADRKMSYLCDVIMTD